MSAGHSALVLLIPEADPVVGALRLRHDPVAREGIAAHVTLLFPFAPVDRIDAAMLARLDDQFAHAPGITGPVELVFDRVARFPDVAYLAFAGADAVAAKIRALAAAWPDYPPYDGRFADIVPHLTIGHGDETVLASIERDLAPALPIIASVQFASLMTCGADGRWRVQARFALS